MKALYAFALLCLAPSLFVRAANGVRDLNTPRTFPEIDSKSEWEKRAKEIREHALVSCGLWPLPEKTPLNAKVFGRVERDGYSIEKVYFETYPGFYLAGNLYRPLGKGVGPFPGILNPHGHWANGRMADQESGSIAARCISFARQGMVAFSYDMVGYNDTRQVPDHRTFATNPTNMLWSISLMGLQTWNSIRALDWLESLPDVDKSRLACTGESGGGTQTFMLGAVDPRLAVQAPIVMVSHSMQGGCLCENAPGLRVDYSNMEIAAAPAPRPQILVAATGDWTKKTMTVEGPAIEKIYDLFDAKDHFYYTIFDYDHNYNKTSREAVYRWFGKWLLHENDPEALKEQPYTKEPDKDLRVFPEGKYPEGALTEAELLASLVRLARRQIEQARPQGRESLERWKEEFKPAWEHDLQLEHVRGAAIISEDGRGSESTIRIKREPDDLEVNLTLLKPVEAKAGTVAIVSSVGDEDREGARALAEKLRDEGVAAIRLSHESIPEKRNQLGNFFCTYNRTAIQDRVAELKVAAQYAREKFPGAEIFVIGRGSAGLAALAAAPLVSGVSADCGALDDSKDENLLELNIFFPGLRRVGSFQGMAALAAPNPLLLHNTAGKMKIDWLGPIYGSNGRGYQHLEQRATDPVITEWLVASKARKTQ